MTALSTAWSTLAGAGLVSGDAPAARQDAPPWYIAALLGICAWVAAVLLAAAMALAMPGLFESALARVVMGLAACAAALLLLYRAGSNIFAAQLALAGSLAGQCVVAWGTFDILEGRHTSVDGPLLPAAIMALLAALMCVAPSSLHRFACIVLVTVWGGVAMIDNTLDGTWPGVVGVLLAGASMADEVWPRTVALVTPVRAALATSVVGWIVALRVMPEAAVGMPLAVLLAVALMLCGGWVARTLALGVARQVAIVALAGLVALLLHGSPGILAGLLVMVVGYSVRHRFIAGLGVLALLAAVSDYYYWMGVDLLTKSAYLAVAGGVLLGVALVLRRKGAA